MKRLCPLLFLLPLPSGAALLPASPPPALASVVVEDLAALQKEYAQAVRKHEQALKSAPDRDARRALRKNPPAKAFWSRFLATSESEPQAIVWLLVNAGDAGLGIQELDDTKLALYHRALTNHAAADWIGGVLDRMPRDRRALGAKLHEYCGLVLEQNASADLKAQALYTRYAVLARSKAEGDAELAEKLLVQLRDSYGDAAFVQKDEVYRRLFLSAGNLAPDFDGRTIDGHEFKLSDYRGKIVLIDFYGFW